MTIESACLLSFSIPTISSLIYKTVFFPTSLCVSFSHLLRTASFFSATTPSWYFRLASSASPSISIQVHASATSTGTFIPYSGPIVVNGILYTLHKRFLPPSFFPSSKEKTWLPKSCPVANSEIPSHLKQAKLPHRFRKTHGISTDVNLRSSLKLDYLLD